MRRTYYEERRAESEGLLNKLKSKSKAYLFGKLITFVVAILFFYYYSGDWNSKWGIASLVAFLFYIILLLLDSRLQKTVKLENNKCTYYDTELAYLDGDFSNLDSGDEFVDPKHPYTFDLDVFGKQSFFHRINRTVSRLGRERLAHWLQFFTLNTEQIDRRKESINELASLASWRTQFIALGMQSKYDLGVLSQIIATEAKKTKIQSLGAKVIMILFTTCTLLAIVGTIYGVVPVSISSAFFLLQLAVAVFFSGKITAVTNEVGGVFKGFKEYQKIIEHIDSVEFSSDKLLYLQEELHVGGGANQAFSELASILNSLNQRANLIAFVFLNGLWIHDLWVYRSFLNWKKEHSPYVNRWVEAITQFDALTSLSTYAFNHPENGEAVFVESTPFVFKGEGLYHPFLKKEKAVDNHFELDSKGFAIVTGANMAGKSTFLRSVGINYVMAMNGLPVCASHLEIRPVNLFSSMRTSDNLAENISYFNAELNRLEQLISFCKGSSHTLIILDEILKGTNSVDKLNGSKLFLNEVSKLPVSGIIATHDLDLAKLEEEDEKYVNYSFEIELGEDIHYTYKITRGVAKNLNATFLLKRIISKIDS